MPLLPLDQAVEDGVEKVPGAATESSQLVVHPAAEISVAAQVMLLRLRQLKNIYA